MWLHVPTFAVICLFMDVTDGNLRENDLEIVFNERSHSDWKNVWHREKFSRCRDTLVKHLYWACEKDIYRITRRNDPSYKTLNNYYNENEIDFPWKTRRLAKQLVRFRRSLEHRSGSSITHECCKSLGCTWEEYAEYCPTNKRYNTYA